MSPKLVPRKFIVRIQLQQAMAEAHNRQAGFMRSSGRESAPSQFPAENNEPTHAGCYEQNYFNP
jgi:hypothetical protein